MTRGGSCRRRVHEPRARCLDEQPRPVPSHKYPKCYCGGRRRVSITSAARGRRGASVVLVVPLLTVIVAAQLACESSPLPTSPLTDGGSGGAGGTGGSDSGGSGGGAGGTGA